MSAMSAELTVPPVDSMHNIPFFPLSFRTSCTTASLSDSSHFLGLLLYTLPRIATNRGKSPRRRRSSEREGKGDDFRGPEVI